MSKMLPPAGPLPHSMMDLIIKLADLWAQEPERPRPTPEICQNWASLIAAWVDDQSLPLYIRKVHNNRGSLVVHSSGRLLVPTDNSPAQWAFALALLGETFSLPNIRQALAQDRIPIAKILKASERVIARYKCTLSKVVNPNSAGWKVAHIDGVGLGDRTVIADIDPSSIREHFRKLISPSNMFVIPLKYAGLGELPEFCRAIGALAKQV